MISKTSQTKEEQKKLIMIIIYEVHSINNGNFF